MSDDDLYYQLRRLLGAGPAILTFRNGRSYRSGGLKWGTDEVGYYAELPVDDFLNSEDVEIDWGLEWVRPADIIRVADAVTGDVLYRSDDAA